MSKYAPARENGKKPYVVTKGGWGRSLDRIGWGETASDAKYDAFGRMGVGEYVTGCRRATPQDMEEIR
jgi:hypothetical protein